MSDLAKPVVEQQLQLHVDVHAELEQQQPGTISSQGGAGQLPPSPSGRASLQQQRSQGGAVPLSPTASSQTSPPQPSTSQSQPSASPLQLPGSPALQQQQRERRRDKLASTLKSSVVYGGSALLSSVTAITPHLAGAVDIMVVQQPDGRLVSTPFYVRFGKYTPLRNKERDVKMYVNGELASFGMHLGSQGHAYFLEPLEPSLDNPSGMDELGRSSNLEPRVPEDDEVEVEAMLAGMMSPASGYSSGGEDGNGRSPRQLLPETALGAALSLQQLQEAQLEAVEGQVPLANMLSLRSMASDSSFGTVAGSSGMNGAAATADAMARTVLSGAEQLVAQQAAQVAVVDSLVTGGTTTTATAVAVGFAQASSPMEARAAAAEAAVAAATNARAETQAAGAQALADAGIVAGHQLQGMQQQMQETQQQQQQEQQQQELSLLEAAAPSVPPVGQQVEGVEAGEDAFQEWLRPEQGAMRRKTVSFSFQGPAEQQLQDAPSVEDESLFTQQRQRVQSSPIVQRSEQQQQHTLEQEVQQSTQGVAQRQGHPQGQRQGPYVSPSWEGRGASSMSALPVPVPVHGFELPEGRSTYADVVRLSPADETLGTSPSSDAGYFGDAEACQAGGSNHSMTHSPPRRPFSQPLPLTSTPPAGSLPAASGAAAATAPEPSLQRHSAGGVVSHLPNRTSCSAPALPALSEQQGSGSPRTPVGPATSVGGLLQTLELSMCGGLLSPQTAEEEAHQLFDRERVHADAFAKHGQEMLASPMLMVRLEGSIYPWTDVAPIFLGAVVFGCRWQHLLPAPSTSWGCLPHCAPGTPGSRGEVIGPDGVKYVPKKASGSWLWPFGGWASNPNATSHSGMALQPQGRSGSLSGMPMGAISAISAPPAMPPGLVAVTGGSPTTYASCPSAPALGSETGGAGGVPLATASAPVYATGRLLMYPRSSSLVLTDGPKLRKVLTPSSDQLASLKLRLGRNRVSYRVGAATEVSAYMYLVRWDTKIVISDVDGTITRSDVLGHLLPAIGLDWSHPGISQLLANVSNNGYQVMYLSSRSIGQANITRDYLNTIVQGEHRMPAGPVIISPDGVLPSLYREMILRRPHEFKIATLSEIRALFPAECNPFYAGFGNRDTDEISYKAVGVPTGRIFIINPKGELRKASTTIQSSTLSTLKAINEILSTIFPPLVGPGAAHWSSTANAGATAGSSSGEESGAAAVPVPTSGLQPAVDEHYNDLQYWGSAADTMDADAELMARYLLPSKPSTSPNSGGAGLARMGSGHLTKQPSAPAIAVSTTPAASIGQAGRQGSDAIEPGVHVSAASAPAVAAAVVTAASAPNSKRRSWGYGRVLRGSPPAFDTTSPQPPAPKPTGSAGGAVQDRKPPTPEDTQAASGGSDDQSDEEDEDEDGDDDEDSLSPRQPSDFLSSYNPFAA